MGLQGKLAKLGVIGAGSAGLWYALDSRVIDDAPPPKVGAHPRSRCAFFFFWLSVRVNVTTLSHMCNPTVQAYPVKQVTHGKTVVHPTWTPPARSEQVRHPGRPVHGNNDRDR